MLLNKQRLNSRKRCQAASIIIEDLNLQKKFHTVNWLFADTPKGAKASATVYSLIETAKANGLNVYTYLEYLLLYMPDVDWRNDPAQLDFLMPWSEAVQAECKR